MAVCKYCLKTIPDSVSECPICGFPVSVPFNVETVKRMWQKDMAEKNWKVEPSLNAIHRAEKESGQMAQEYGRTMNQQRPPVPGQYAAPGYTPQANQYPNNPRPPYSPQPQPQSKQEPRYPQPSGLDSAAWDSWFNA